VPASDDPLTSAYLEHLRNERNASPRTVDNYERALRAAAEFLGDKSWRAATADDFRAYLFALMKRERSRATIRLEFAALRSFYRFLCERKGLATNPLLAVSLPKADKRLPVFLTTASSARARKNASSRSANPPSKPFNNTARAPKSKPARSSSANCANVSAPPPSGHSSKNIYASRRSPCPPARTNSATASPPTYSMPAPTSAACKASSATPACRPRRFTRTSPPSG